MVSMNGGAAFAGTGKGEEAQCRVE